MRMYLPPDARVFELRRKQSCCQGCLGQSVWIRVCWMDHPAAQLPLKLRPENPFLFPPPDGASDHRSRFAACRVGCGTLQTVLSSWGLHHRGLLTQTIPMSHSIFAEKHFPVSYPAFSSITVTSEQLLLGEFSGPAGLRVSCLKRNSIS